MLIDKYIENALSLYECVIVPSFGSFSLDKSEDGSSGYSLSDDTVNQKSISFNRSLRVNDGIFVNYLANTKGISYSEALAEINKAVDGWLTKLERGSKVIIENVGQIYEGSDGSWVFDYTRSKDDSKRQKEEILKSATNINIDDFKIKEQLPKQDQSKEQKASITENNKQEPVISNQKEERGLGFISLKKDENFSTEESKTTSHNIFTPLEIKLDTENKKQNVIMNSDKPNTLKTSDTSKDEAVFLDFLSKYSKEGEFEKKLAEAKDTTSSKVSNKIEPANPVFPEKKQSNQITNHQNTLDNSRVETTKVESKSDNIINREPAFTTVSPQSQNKSFSEMESKEQPKIENKVVGATSAITSQPSINDKTASNSININASTQNSLNNKSENQYLKMNNNTQIPPSSYRTNQKKSSKGSSSAIVVIAVILFIAILSAVGYYFYISDKEEPVEVVETTIVEEPEDNTPAQPLYSEPVVENKEPVVAALDKRYYIIAGAFSNPSNADRLLNDLRAKGFDATFAGYGTNGVKLVAYGATNSRSEAEDMFIKAIYEGNKDAWIKINKSHRRN